MRRQALKFVGPALVVAVLGIVLWVNAGDLNPPLGGVTPTMLTLQEIGDKVDGVSQKIDNIQPGACCEPVWEYKWMSLSLSSGEVLAVPGAGVLHGVDLKGGSGAECQAMLNIWDGPSASGHRLSALFVSGTNDGYVVKNEFFQFDVAFSNGLYIDAPTGGGVHATFFYRSTN